ncbi:DUF3500 domain-containing protein [Calycomorphotria hydatis]|uniref:DUF3500 domain-containing protein n=1 Tax=Calycomorphotria hydatis TaxID=2528027 RepID=A0A517T3C1_9PLAN|nr:DUF3500 domain-containing protein [Calycomorphotria hydatis]QDT62831.1 hypothetical protein V22_00290 [Calycomorphotria hydatis]
MATPSRLYTRHFPPARGASRWTISKTYQTIGLRLWLVLFAITSGLLANTSIAHDGPAAEMATAANQLISVLDDAQKEKALFKFSDDQRENWHFLPDMFIKPDGKRFGLPLKEMTVQQQLFAKSLLNAALSHKGQLQVATVMALETVLHDLGERPEIRDPEVYYVQIFGTPDAHGTWAWRWEGHHLSINVTIVKGELFAVTPSFFGTNPAKVPSGPLKGLRVLADHEDLARKLVTSLTAEQQKKAVLEGKVPKDIFTGESRVAETDLFDPHAGITADQLDSQQRETLAKLVAELIGHHRAELRASTAAHFEERLGTAEEPGTKPNDVTFAWIGSTEVGKPHYFRIVTSKVLFEYDNIQNNANHVHLTWREFDSDFGRDLLREHHAKHHGKN